MQESFRSTKIVLFIILVFEVEESEKSWKFNYVIIALWQLQQNVLKNMKIV